MGEKGGTVKRPTDQAPFYDDIAEYYDLIYAYWQDRMDRHGAAISAMFGAPKAMGSRGGFRVLDAAAGIGTQALPLAALGYHIVA